MHWTAIDIPDQSGRVAIVTGANTGLGFETAKALAARGARVVLAVRDTGKGKDAATAIGGDVDVTELDLTSLDSIRAAADEVKSRYERIDLLINNAGVMTTPKSTTKDGFELQFGTNHLGHFALTGLLLDRIADVPGARIVTVSSNGHKMLADIHFDDLQWERSYSRLRAYSQSKLANLLFTYELQRRLAQANRAVAVAAHPGISSTELMRYLPAALQLAMPVFRTIVQTPAMGVLPTLRAATDPGVLGAEYYGPDGPGGVRGYPKVVPSSDRSQDVELQRQLWTVSEELTGVTFPTN